MSENNRFQLKRDYIVEQLREAIANGELKPGQKLRQEELAARFNISSTPVREALRRLEAEGLVTAVPHQGVFVTRLNVAAIEENFRLRELLETHALKEAMKHLQTHPTRLAKLMDDLAQFQAALKTAAENKSEEATKINQDLHLRLYDEAHSPLLRQMIIDLWKHLPLSSFWLIPGRSEQAHVEHENLFAAIRRGETETAEVILREHIAISARAFLERFQNTNLIISQL